MPQKLLITIHYTRFHQLYRIKYWILRYWECIALWAISENLNEINRIISKQTKNVHVCRAWTIDEIDDQWHSMAINDWLIDWLSSIYINIIDNQWKWISCFKITLIFIGYLYYSFNLVPLVFLWLVVVNKEICSAYSPKIQEWNFVGNANCHRWSSLLFLFDNRLSTAN